MPPKVVLSAGNIAHYHHTALALQQAGYLWRYFCVFSGKNDLGFVNRFLPSNMRKRLSGKALPDLDQKRIRTFVNPYLLAQMLRRMKLVSQERANALFSALYDHATTNRVDGIDIFHFVNGMGLQTAQRVKKAGGMVICDVRAEHVDYQEAVLRSEYDKLGLPYQSTRALYREKLVSEYALADALFVPSSHVAGTFVQYGMSRNKIYVLPYGVDFSGISRSKSYPVQQGKKISRPFRILFVGQVIPLKGVHYLIQAFANLQLPNSELVIIGHGELGYRAMLTKMMPSSYSVRFVDHIPQTELWQHYLESDVFVLPSLGDSFGLVVSEAMAAGLPVIVSENTGAKELVRDGFDGFVIPARDMHALQEKLVYLYEHPWERQEMGHAALGRVQEFTWERYGERLLLLYGQILKHQGY